MRFAGRVGALPPARIRLYDPQYVARIADSRSGCRQSGARASCFVADPDPQAAATRRRRQKGRILRRATRATYLNTPMRAAPDTISAAAVRSRAPIRSVRPRIASEMRTVQNASVA